MNVCMFIIIMNVADAIVKAPTQRGFHLQSFVPARIYKKSLTTIAMWIEKYSRMSS